MCYSTPLNKARYDDDDDDDVDEKDRQLAIEYLQKYGFLASKSNTSILDVEIAVTNFQDHFQVPSSGRLTRKTINFMKQPRCGLSDTANLEGGSPKWNKTTLKWRLVFYSQINSDAAKQLIELAFTKWENVTNLHFKETKIHKNAYIVISFASRKHSMKNGATCQTEFDGPGNVLVHAFFHTTQTPKEIHLDASENWSTNLGKLPNSYIGLFQVVFHEIGHSLGLYHLNVYGDVMFPAYNENAYHLGYGNIEAIQKLYGKSMPKTTTTTTTTVAPTTPIMKTAAESSLFCDIANKINNFVIINYQMFMYYNGFLWEKILDGEHVEHPVALSSFIQHIPSTAKIHAAYVTQDDILVIHADEYIYSFTLGNFNLIAKQKDLHIINNNFKLMGAVVTYRGHTYRFYAGNFLVKQNNCGHPPSSNSISAVFSSVPTNFTGVFRYTNGFLYFFDEEYYYEYDEFRNRLVRSFKRDISVFGINCVNRSLLEQLQSLVYKMLY